MPWLLCGYNVDNDRNAHSLGIETARCSQALIIRAIHSVVSGIKQLHDAFLINGILYVEKALLSGGFDAIKWHIGS